MTAIERTGDRLAAAVGWSGTAAALAASFVLDPARVDAGPVLCPFRLVTGHSCLTCGMTRGFVRFAHGDLGGALDAHPLAPLVFVIAAIALVVKLTTLIGAAWPRRDRRRSLPLAEPLGHEATDLGGVAGHIAAGVAQR